MKEASWIVLGAAGCGVLACVWVPLLFRCYLRMAARIQVAPRPDDAVITYPLH